MERKTKLIIGTVICILIIIYIYFLIKRSRSARQHYNTQPMMNNTQPMMNNIQSIMNNTQPMYIEPPPLVSAQPLYTAPPPPAMVEKLLSQGKPITMSPPWSNFPAENCVDNNLDTFCHSDNGNNLYTEKVLEVDLMDTYTITRIVLENRRDCCQDMLEDYIIKIDGTQVLSDSGNSRLSITHQINNIKGRIVTLVTGKSTRKLHLAEIRIYGY